MIPLNLPPFEIKITKQSGHFLVYDPLRHRKVTLTPEEWVRQHFVNFLISIKHFPATLMANEVTIAIGGNTRRCDTVLYSKVEGRPRVVIEYKAPHIKITQETFNQISAYNSILRADYLIVSNGLQHYCCHIDYNENRYEFLKDIPDFNDL